MNRTELIFLLIFAPYAALMLGVAWLAWAKFFRSEKLVQMCEHVWNDEDDCRYCGKSNPETHTNRGDL